MVRRSVRLALFAIALAALSLIACARKESTKQDTRDAWTPSTPVAPTAVPSVATPLEPPTPPPSLVLPPLRTDVERPCTGRFVPLCFEALPGGCCGTSVTYAHCGEPLAIAARKTWACPPQMTLGSTCPGTERGCVDAIKRAVDSYGR